MDADFTNIVSGLASYGALGIVTLYFMAKDWIRGKKTDEVIEKNTEVIKEFTVALNVLQNVNRSNGGGGI